jgi:aerobic-type carbon monoxide dehydrogenase small subunit (CoxS/CutS family)
MSVHRIRLAVNGVARELDVEADEILLDVLRDRFGLTGTKEGCGVGVCGACSVLVDGGLVSGCLVPVARLDGANVTTVEGLAGPGGKLSPVQERFIADGGFQCGICTPGQLVAATALLMAEPDPSVERIREWMTGNLCRCTGYLRIIEAVRRSASHRVDQS